MPSYGQSVVLQYVAWDSGANGGKTGDVANHTLRWVKDGTSAAPTNTPAEVDATNAPGVYKLTLTSSECQCQSGTLCGKSSTAGVSILPVSATFENLPTATPNSSGGLLTYGTSTGQLNPTAGLVTLAAATHTGAVIPTVSTVTNAVVLNSNIKKNQSLAGYQFFMALSTDHVSPATGKTITAIRSIDGGAFASCANTAAEIAGGWYAITLAAADLNGNSIALAFSATGCDTTQVTIITQP